MVSCIKLIAYITSVIISGLFLNQKVLLNFFNGSNNHQGSPFTTFTLIAAQQIISFVSIYCSLWVIAKMKTIEFRPRLNIFILELSKAKYPHAFIIFIAYLARELEPQSPFLSFSLFGLIIFSVFALGLSYLSFGKIYINFKWRDSLFFIFLLVISDFLIVGLSSLL